LCYVNLFFAKPVQKNLPILVISLSPLLSLLPFPTINTPLKHLWTNTWRHLLIKHGRIPGGEKCVDVPKDSTVIKKGDYVIGKMLVPLGWGPLNNESTPYTPYTVGIHWVYPLPLQQGG